MRMLVKFGSIYLFKYFYFFVQKVLPSLKLQNFNPIIFMRSIFQRLMRHSYCFDF